MWLGWVLAWIVAGSFIFSNAKRTAHHSLAAIIALIALGPVIALTQPWPKLHTIGLLALLLTALLLARDALSGGPGTQQNRWHW